MSKFRITKAIKKDSIWYVFFNLKNGAETIRSSSDRKTAEQEAKRVWESSNV